MVNKDDVDRRKFLQTAGAAGVTGTASMLAGCSGGKKKQTTTTAGNTTTKTTDQNTTETTDEDPSSGGTLTAALQADPWTLNPHKLEDVSSRQLAANYGNRLLTVGPDGDLQPDLAKEVPEPMDGGKKYVLKLHEGVQFHGDYGEMTAEDVVANFRKILDVDYGSPARPAFEGLLVGENIDITPQESVRATGEYEVTFTLAEPYVPFRYRLTVPKLTIIAPGAIEEYGEDLGTPDVGIWATGPFQYVEGTPDDHYTLERNPNYFKSDDTGTQLPYLDKLRFNIVPENSVRTTQLRTGGIDVSEYVSAQSVQKLKQDSNIGVNSRPSSSNLNLYINQRNFEPFTNRSIRKALAYASNKEAIKQTKFKGLAATADSIFPPWNWGYDESAVTKYDHNPEKAKTLIQEAGADGLSFNCTPTNQPLFVDVATILQQNFRQVGLNMEITPKEKSAAWGPVLGKWDPKAAKPNDKVGPSPSYNSHTEDISFEWDPDSYAYRAFHTEASLNVSYYSNDQVDTWLEKARTTTNRKKRKEYYRKIQSQVTDDVPQIFQVWWNVNQGYRMSVHNFQTYPTSSMYFEEVWIKGN